MQEERETQDRRSDQTSSQTARKYVSKRTICTYCGVNVTATNLARHQNSRACMASDHQHNQLHTSCLTVRKEEEEEDDDDDCHYNDSDYNGIGEDDDYDYDGDDADNDNDDDDD